MNPIPAEPSPQSVRALRRRQRGNREVMAKIMVGGARLRLARALFRLIAATIRVPRSVRTTKERSGTWYVAEGADEARGALLYIHGGGFVLPSVHKHAGFLFSQLCGIPVFLPTCRLAPEHPFPAAADDVLAAYRHLLDRGIPADKIRIAADSSGGFLATALLGDLERAGLPLPAAVLLMSPLVDLSVSLAKQRDEVHRDPATSPRFIEVTNEAYLAGTPLTDPRVDVLGADKQNWPPVLVQTGDTECLVTENERLAESIEAAGGRCELQLWPGQLHGFAIYGNKLPEAVAAREYAAGFLTRGAGRSLPS